MGSLVYFYFSTFLWMALTGLVSYCWTKWRRPSLHRALIYRLAGWIIIFLALIRRLGWTTGAAAYRTLGGDSALEVMDERMFWSVVTVGLFCLFVAWITQYTATGGRAGAKYRNVSLDPID